MSASSQLFQITFAAAPTATVGPFTSGSLYAGLTTGDTAVSYALDGTNTVTFHPANIVSVDADGNSADASKGQGFLAEACEGSISIADVDISGAISTGAIQFIGASLLWGDYDPAQTPALYQTIQRWVYDIEVKDDGSVTLKLRSQLGVSTAVLHGTRTFTEHPSDPTDSSNPTDPTYADDEANWRSVAGYAGRAFGNEAVSIKAGSSLSVQTLCRYNATTKQSGDISSITNPIAYEVATVCDEFAARVTDSNGMTTSGAGIFMKCRVSDPTAVSAADTTEAVRFCAQLQAYLDGGYRLVLSDGNWSADLSEANYNGIISFTKSGFYFNTGGASFGYMGVPKGIVRSSTFAVVWFNLCDSDGQPLYPSNGLTPRNIKLYAVPSSILVAAHQVITKGFVSSEKVKTATFSELFEGVDVLNPSAVTDQGFYLCEAIQIPLNLNVDGASDDPTPAQWTHRYGATAWNKSLSANTVSGSTNDINTDPNTQPSTSGYPIVIAGTASATSDDTTLSVQLWLNFPEVSNGDFYCIDISYLLAASTSGSPSDTPTLKARIRSSYWPDAATDGFSVLGSSHAASLSKKVKAKSTLSHPIWRKKITSLKLSDLTSNQSFLYAFAQSSQTGTINLTVKLSELFVWAFSQISFSEVYPVVFPGFREVPISGVDAGSTAVVAVGGQTLSVAYPSVAESAYSDPAKWAWLNTDLGATATGTPSVGAVVLLSHSAASAAVALGTRTLAGVATLASWTSTSLDGSTTPTWTETSLGLTGKGAPTCGLCDSAYILFTTSSGWVVYSVNGTIAWTAVQPGSMPLHAVASSGSLYLVVGDAGFIAAGATPASLAVLTAPTTAAIHSAVFDAALLRWVLAADDGIWTADVASASTVPTTWTNRTSGTFHTVSLANGVLLATGAAPKTSTDGITWSAAAYGFGDDLPTCAAVYGTSRILAGSSVSNVPSLWVQRAGGTGTFDAMFTPTPETAARSLSRIIGSDVGPNPLQINGIASWKSEIVVTGWATPASIPVALYETSSWICSGLYYNGSSGILYGAFYYGAHTLCCVASYQNGTWVPFDEFGTATTPRPYNIYCVGHLGSLTIGYGTNNTSGLDGLWWKDLTTFLMTGLPFSSTQTVVAGGMALMEFNSSTLVVALFAVVTDSSDSYAKILFANIGRTHQSYSVAYSGVSPLGAIAYDAGRSRVYAAIETNTSRGVWTLGVFDASSSTALTLLGSPSLTLTSYFAAAPTGMAYSSGADMISITGAEGVLVLNASDFSEVAFLIDASCTGAPAMSAAGEIWTGHGYNTVYDYKTQGAISRPGFGISFDPPSTATSGPSTDSGTSPSDALKKIMEEWWGYAGEMEATSVDGSNDTLKLDLPTINLGNIEDVANEFSISFHKFGGDYLKTAYITHTDEDFVFSKGTGYYFSGFDDPSTAWTSSNYTSSQGYQIWAYCRAAYQETLTTRYRSWDMDSVHAEADLGALYLASDPVLGVRIRHICRRPLYLTLTVEGNRNATAGAYCGAIYKHNPLILAARGISLPPQGIVVKASHDPIAGTHEIECIYSPL